MIQNLAFRILFLKYYFRHAAFLYSSARSSGHIKNYKNNILPQQKPKIFSKIKNQQKRFCLVSENSFAVLYLDSQELHS